MSKWHKVRVYVDERERDRETERLIWMEMEQWYCRELDIHAGIIEDDGSLLN